jgi:hypothetical protein
MTESQESDSQELITGGIGNFEHGFIPHPQEEKSVEDLFRLRIKELEGRMVDQAITICEVSKLLTHANSKIRELEKGIK